MAHRSPRSLAFPCVRGLLGVLLSLCLLFTSAFAADWTPYIPEGLPPLVLDAYPGKGVQLRQARQAGPQPSAVTRTLVDALVTDCVGPGARWFVRLGNDSADALAVSLIGLKGTRYDSEILHR